MLVCIIGSILGTTCLRAEVWSFRPEIRHIPSRCSMANWSVLRCASRKHPRSPDHRPHCRAIRLPTHHARRPYRFDRIPLHSILRCQHQDASRWLPFAWCRLISLPVCTDAHCCSLKFPWGTFQTMSVSYAADVMPVHLRQYLTTYVNLCWVIGQIIASGVLRGLVGNDTQWAYRVSDLP